MAGLGFYLVSQPDSWAANDDSAVPVTEVVAAVVKSIVVGEELANRSAKEKREFLMGLLGVAVASISEFAPGFGAPTGYAFDAITKKVVNSVKRKGLSASTNEDLKLELHHLFLMSVTSVSEVAKDSRMAPYRKIDANGVVTLHPPEGGKEKELFWEIYTTYLPDNLLGERSTFTNSISVAVIGEQVDMIQGKKG